MKTINTAARNTAADLAAYLDNAPAAYLKAAYCAQEKRYFDTADLVRKLSETHAADLADMDSARKRHDADAFAAARARCADLAAAMRKLSDIDRQYSAALIKLAASRLASVTRRAYDPHAAHAADLDATPAQLDAAADSACNPVILRLRAESVDTVRGALKDAAAVDFYDADRISDAADVMNAAALAILDTRADRAVALDRADAAHIAPLDYAYTADSDSARRRPSCAMTRANRAAERYINGRRGLNVSDRRTVYIEDLTDADDGREAEAIYRRAGVYASLNYDGYISGVTLDRVESMLSAVNLTDSEKRRMWRYVGGMSFEQVAAAENVSKRAAAKSIYSARDKILNALTAAARRAADDGKTNAATALDRIAADLAAHDGRTDLNADTAADLADLADLAARAADRTHAAPVYMSDYTPTLTAPDAARALDAARADKAISDRIAAAAEWDIAAYTAAARADAARADMTAAARRAARAAALYTPADIDARRAAALDAVDLTDAAAARRAAAAAYNAAAASAADLTDRAHAADAAASAAHRELYILTARRRAGLTAADVNAAHDAAARADSAARRAWEDARAAAARRNSAAARMRYIDGLTVADRATLTAADRVDFAARARAAHDAEHAAAVAADIAAAV